MIKVNGNTFRTLAEPMYVNGKHVLEAWENGTKVYPEVDEGTIVKAKGRVALVCSHSHDGEEHPPPYGATCGPCTSFYSVIASFAIVIKGIQNVTFSVSDTLQNLRQSERENHGTVYGGLLQAVNPLDGAPTVKTRPILYQKTGQYFSTQVEIKAKYNISPLPVCGPITRRGVVPPDFYEMESSETVFQPDYYGPSPDYYTYIPVNTTMSGPEEFNGEIFHGDGYGVTVKSRGHPFGEVCVVPVSNSTGGAILECVYIYADWYRFPIIWPYRDNTTREMVYPTVWAPSKGVALISIPVTDCMYIGDVETAPEWAKTVYDTDLD